MTRTSILVGRVAGAALLGFVQAWFFFGVATIFGMRSEGGILSLFLVSIVASIVAAGMGSISVAFALKTGSTEAVQGSLSAAVFTDVLLECVLPPQFDERMVQNPWRRSIRCRI